MIYIEITNHIELVRMLKRFKNINRLINELYFVQFSKKCQMVVAHQARLVQNMEKKYFYLKIWATEGAQMLV